MSTLLHYNIDDRKARLWTEARECGDKLAKALADGDRILSVIYAQDVICAVQSLSEIEHIQQVSKFFEPENYSKLRNKLEEVPA